MSTEKSTRTMPLFARIVAVVSGLLVASGLALLSYFMGNTSFAKGIMGGATLTLVALIILWWRGTRGGTSARLVSGVADERDRLLATHAAADAGFVMLMTAVAGTVASLWDLEGYIVGGLVIYAGLITFAVSLIVRVRRS